MKRVASFFLLGKIASLPAGEAGFLAMTERHAFHFIIRHSMFDIRYSTGRHFPKHYCGNV